MKKAVICLAKNEAQADRIVQRLLSSNFDNQDVSILMNDKQRTRLTNIQYSENTVPGQKKKVTSSPSSMGYEKHTKAPEGAATGAIAGGILGGSLGLLAGIGSLAIPGIGPFIAAGPIMAALSGSAIGGGLGLLTGALVGMEIPEIEAKQYEGKLNKGYILISAHTENNEQVNFAKEVMKNEGAENISVINEKKVKAKTTY